MEDSQGISQSHTISVALEVTSVPRFLEYLSVALSKFKQPGSQGEWTLDGGFREEFHCKMLLATDREVQATWSISVSSDGRLAPIRVTVPQDASVDWIVAVESVVRETLIDLVNGSGEKFFQRHLFAYFGFPLDGEYYLPGFRLAPSLPTSSFPFGLAEEVLMIDLYAEGIDAGHAATLGKIQAVKLASLLSLFLDVGFYRLPSVEARWFLSEANASKCAQLGYRSSIPVPIKMPRKGVECKPGTAYDVDRSKIEDWSRSIDKLRCPKDIRLLFRTFNELSPPDQSVFLGAASLYQLALVAGKNFPSLRIAYLVAAVDALGKGNKTMKSFLELIARLAPEIQPEEARNLYERYRSAHFHAGSLPGGEQEVIDFSGGLLATQRDLLAKFNYPATVRAHLRTVLLRWLLSLSSPPANKNEDIKRELAELKERIKSPTTEVTEKHPGMSLHAVLRLHELNDPRRKYLFDFGRLDNDRFSIYLDQTDVLTFAILSNRKEPYLVKVPPVNVPFEQFIYLSCELAIGNKSTSMRVLINGELIAALNIPYKIQSSAVERTGGTVGADLTGNNGARVDMSEIVLFGATLTSAEVSGLIEGFRSRSNAKFVQFDGDRWMRDAGKGKGFVQDIPEAQPTFRDLDNPKQTP